MTDPESEQKVLSPKRKRKMPDSPIVADSPPKYFAQQNPQHLDNPEQDVIQYLEDLPTYVPAACPQETNYNQEQQFMSYEVPPVSPFVHQFAPSATGVPLMGMQHNQIVQNSYTQDNPFPTSTPLAHTVADNWSQKVQAPGHHTVLKNLNTVPIQPQINNKQGLPQNLNDSPECTPQVKKRIYKKRQKVTDENQQPKRPRKKNTRQPNNIHPNLQSPALTPFPDGMLLNNAAAPSVTLQGSAGMHNPQQPWMYNVQQTAPSQSDCHLFPDQPFSPVTRQYPQSTELPSVPPQVFSSKTCVHQQQQRGSLFAEFMERKKQMLQGSAGMPNPQQPRMYNVQQTVLSQSGCHLFPDQLFSPMAKQYPQSTQSPDVPPQVRFKEQWKEDMYQKAHKTYSAEIAEADQRINEILNAKLLQASHPGQQSQFENQQPQVRPMAMCSIPGTENYPGLQNSPFHPPSPVVTIYQQQQSGAFMAQQPQ